MNNKKNEILAAISMLLESMEAEERKTVKTAEPEKAAPVEMLTVKECCKAIKGLNEYTVRQLVSRNEIPHIRAGKGKNGKILIPKSALVAYFSVNTG